MTSVAVVGVGSIGGYLAAQLLGAGHAVTLCSRRPFSRLTVESAGDVVSFDVVPLLDPIDAQPVEIVLLATKTHQTVQALPWLERLCGPSTRLVACLQNGIESEEALQGELGAVPIAQAVVWCGAEQLDAGHVRHHGASRLVVPARARELVRVFAGTDVTVDAVEDFTTAAWSKLMVNVVTNPIAGLTLRRLDVFQDPQIAALGHTVALECIAVARAEGAAIEPDEAAALIERLRSQPPTMGSSMLYDRLAGRPTEGDAICGAVVRAGRRNGVPTPLTEALMALLGAAAPLDRVHP